MEFGHTSKQATHTTQDDTVTTLRNNTQVQVHHENKSKIFEPKKSQLYLDAEFSTGFGGASFSDSDAESSSLDCNFRCDSSSDSSDELMAFSSLNF